MKKGLLNKIAAPLVLVWVLSLWSANEAQAQKSFGVGTDAPHPRAVLELNVINPSSYPQGLLLPRLTAAQRLSLATVPGLPQGMSVFDTDDNQFYLWNGSAWNTPAAALTTITAINGISLTTAGQNFTIDGGNFLQLVSSFSGDVSGLYNSLQINSIQSIPVSISGITAGQYLFFDGASITGVTFSVPAATSITGANGISINQNGQAFTIDGSNFLSSSITGYGDVSGSFANGFTVTGLQGAPINKSLIQNNYLLQYDGSSIVGVSLGQLQTTLTGTNGVTVSGVGNNYTIDGQNLSAGSGIQIAGNQIINTSPNIPVTLTGANGLGISGTNNDFTITGQTFSTQATTLTGQGVTILGTGTFDQTIVGQNLVAGNNVTITGNQIDVAAPTPYTSITGTNGLIVSGAANGFTIDGSNFLSSSITGYGDVSGSFANGFTVTGLKGVPINSSTIQPNYLLQFDGSSVVGFNPIQAYSTISGANGIGINQSGQAFTIDGAAFVTSLVGGNNITVNQSGGVYTISGPNQWLGTSNLYTNSFVGIGSSSAANQQLTVFGNSSVTGTGYFGTLVGNNLAGAAGSIVTVDGFGQLGLGTLPTGLSGAGTPSGIAYFSSANAITSDGANFSYDPLTKMLTLGNLSVYSTSVAGSNNFFVNSTAGNTFMSATDNNFLGYQAGANSTSGKSNNFLGKLSGYTNTTGQFNNFLGEEAGYANISGSHNNFFGYQAGTNNTTGQFNNFLGVGTGSNNTIGYGNNFLGQYAGTDNVDGNNNVFIGAQAGVNNVSGYNNIAIGNRAGFTNSSISNAIAIGAYASVSGNNMMALGGVGANALIVGIGTTTPANTLHVVGGARIENLSVSGYVQADALGNLFVSTIGGFVGIATPSSSLTGLALTSSISTISTTGTGLQYDNVNERLFLGQSVFQNLKMSIASDKGDANMLLYNVSTNSGNGFLAIGHARGTLAAQQAVQQFDLLGGVGFGGYDGTALFSSGPTATIEAYAAENFSSSNQGSRLVFRVADIGSPNANAAMAIEPGGQVVVGSITGVYRPYAALQIVSGGNKGVLLPKVTTDQRTVLGASLTSGDAGMLIYDTDVNDVGIWNGTNWKINDGSNNNNPYNEFWNMYASNSIGGTNLSTTGYGFLGTADKYGFVLRTDNQDRLFISSTGEIGVGTNSPASRFEIFATTLTGMRVVQSSTSDVAGGFINSDPSNPQPALYAYTENTTTGLAFWADGKVKLSAYTDGVLTVDGFGNLGVGNLSSGNSLWQINGSYIEPTAVYDINIPTLTGVYRIAGNAILRGDGSNIMLGTTGNTVNIGIENNIIGNGAGQANYSGNFNNFMGSFAGTVNVDGSENIFLGYNSGYGNVNGDYNIALGSNSGYYSDGDNNIFIGNFAGKNTNGSNNIAIGQNAGVYNNATNAVAIGTNAVAQTSNTFIIGGTGADAVKVGIGTDSPSATLHVVGNAIIESLNVLASGGIVTVDGSGNLGVGTMPSGTSQWLTTGSDINYSAGNVGIGTSSPLNALHVYSPSSGTGKGLLVSGYNGALNLGDILGTDPLGSRTWHLDNYSGDFRLYTQPNLTTSGNVMLYVNQSGNVGLGLDNNLPVATLDVLGNARLTGPLTLSGLAGAPANLGIDANGEVITVSGSGSQWTDDAYGIVYGQNIGIGVASTDPNIKFLLHSTVAGVGTAYSGINSTVWSMDNTFVNYVYALQGYANGAGGGDQVYGGFFSAQGTGADVTYGGYFEALGGSQNYGLVVASGAVGIGTTAPSNTLDVAGGVTIGSSYAGTYGGPANGLAVEGHVGIGVYSVTNYLEVAGGVAIGSTYAGSGLSAPDDGLIIQGQVGIGTTSPDDFALLDLTTPLGKKAKGLLLPRLDDYSANFIGGNMDPTQEGLFIYNLDHKYLQFWDGSAWQTVGSGGTSQWTDDSFGIMYNPNVSIGANTPGNVKFNVNYDITTSVTGLYYGVSSAINNSNGGNNNTFYAVLGLANGATSDVVYGGYFTAAGGDNNYGLVVNQGNVGIGTTTPDPLHRFEVVPASGTSLYVSENEYIKFLSIENENTSGQTGIFIKDGVANWNLYADADSHEFKIGNYDGGWSGLSVNFDDQSVGIGFAFSGTTTINSPNIIFTNFTNGGAGGVLSVDGFGNLSVNAGGGSGSYTAGTGIDITGGVISNLITVSASGDLNMTGTFPNYVISYTATPPTSYSGGSSINITAGTIDLNTIGGDISGSDISSITVDRIKGIPVVLNSLTAGDVLSFDGSTFVNTPGPSAGSPTFSTSAGVVPLITSDQTTFNQTVIEWDFFYNRLALNGNDIVFSTSGDANHGIGFYSNSKQYVGNDINGPVLYGNKGGALGINNSNSPLSIALAWSNPSSIADNSMVSINNSNYTDITATLDVNGSARIRNLSVLGTGGMVTVDGLGNLGVGAISSAGLTGTAAAGNIAFFASPTSLTGTSDFNWDNTNKRFVAGTGNVNSGYASIAIGSNATANGNRAFAIGNNVDAEHLGSFVLGDWSAGSPSLTQSSADDQFTARFGGGYRFYTKSDLSAGVFFTNTNVGINISSPLSALQVNKDLGLGDATGSTSEEGVITIWLINNSGGTVNKGSIVIIDGAADNSFTTTSTQGSNQVAGVAYENITNGAIGRIAIKGVMKVSVVGTAVPGQHVITSTTAGAADVTAVPSAGTSIGIWLESASGSARVLLK